MVNSPRAGGYTEETELVLDIVSAVAEKTGSDPFSLTPPLGEVIDTDALERLLQGSSNDVSATFEYQGQTITVGSEGRFELRDAHVGD